MKVGKWIGLGVLVSLGVLFAGLIGGWFLGRFSWRTPTMAAGLMPNSTPYTASCDESGSVVGPGMMRWQTTDDFCDTYTNITPGTCAIEEASEGCPLASANVPTLDDDLALNIEEAQTALETYIADLGYDNLEIVDMMEFERNFYAIARETDTGIGAMELLVDKSSGAVSPEMGPNMMWNAKYGMRRRGMTGAWSRGENTLFAAEALKIAQTWLDENRPGVTVEEDADPFYGYYTIHTYTGDAIEGMLSVNGTSSQVWYHTWHGEFIQMLEEK